MISIATPISVQSPRSIRSWGKDITIDPLMRTPPTVNGGSSENEDRWGVWSWNIAASSAFASNGGVRFICTNKPANADFRPLTPAYLLDRRFQYRVSYRTRINQTINGAGGSLTAKGYLSKSQNYDEQYIYTYQTKNVNETDGWVYKEFVLPSYTFKGDHVDSYNRIGHVRFMWMFEWNNPGQIDVEFKDFRISSEKVLSSPRSVLAKRS